jgi:hypothetical protein
MQPNLLTLHEAIAVVLLNCTGRTATVEAIAAEINRRQLYVRKDGKALPPYQVKMRTQLSKGRYQHLFACGGDGIVSLR